MLESVKNMWNSWFRITPSDSLYDRSLIWLYVSLLFIGLVMVASASISVNLKDPFALTKNEAINIVIGLCLFVFFLQVSMSKWEKYNVLLLAASFFLLCCVLFTKDVNGAKRWISLGGFNFQASELAKLAIICYFSSFYHRKFDEMRKSQVGFWRPATVVILFVAVLTYQSDFGSIVLLFGFAFGLLFIMGGRLLQFGLLSILLIITGGGYIYLSSYRMGRIAAYQDPFADVYGNGFQLANSQMAFGQGELLGRGLGNSIQKLKYLPEAHTDFIMAVVGEELGMLGVIFILFLLAFLIFKAIIISQESLIKEERFKGYFSFGIAMWLFAQLFINLGGATGLIPSKGLTFPFISYGGSSLLIFSIAIAILIRIDHENRASKIGFVRKKRNKP